MYFFAKGLVIPHHYHGVSQVAATYLNREYDIPFIDYYKTLFSESRYGKGILNKEYINHTNSLKESLFENKTWGRTIEGGDDFHIQDNGATASFLYKNIDEVHKEIVNIVEKEYGVNVSEACRFNKHIIDTYKRDNIEKQFNKNWYSWFYENKPLVNVNNIVSVVTHKYNDILDHSKHLFWWGRKAKRCFLKSKEIML